MCSTAIDINREELLTLSAAAKTLPRRNGKAVHSSTVWRWACRGVAGVRLQTCKLGGTRYTSREAIARFSAELSAERPLNATFVPTLARRRRDLEKTKRELAEAGI